MHAVRTMLQRIPSAAVFVVAAALMIFAYLLAQPAYSARSCHGACETLQPPAQSGL